MTAKSVVGIDLGKRKSGVCWISGDEVVRLETFQTENLVASLTGIEQQDQHPTAIVVDAPIDPTEGAGFRLIDRVFMRGLFNNNHVGLQPNNPDLLNMKGEIQALIEWCKARNIHYTNEFPSQDERVLRETMPNPAFGILSSPNALLQLKEPLRFRYGRGKNIAPITVAFECHANAENQLFAPLQHAPKNWKELEGIPQGIAEEQSDDLIAALVCASLAWWHVNSDQISFVKEARGHYLLPPAHMIHTEWIAEICQILDHDDFATVKTNLCPNRHAGG
jgi:predicted RNase H-like nuclease